MPSSRSRKNTSSERLKQALLALLSEIAYEQITVDLLCSQAGVTRKTFYNHFDSQQQLMSILATEFIFAPAIAEVERLIEQELEIAEVVRQLIDAQIDRISQRDPVREQIFSLNTGERALIPMLKKLEMVLQQLFRASQQRGDIQPGFSAEYLAKVMLSSWLMACYSQETDEDLTSLRDQNIRMMLMLCSSN